MSTTFPRTRTSRKGYSIDQVEDFLEDARRAYSAELGEVAVVNSASIRQMAFELEKGGYSSSHVDAALERLEDAFAARERERGIQVSGDEAWYTEARAIAQDVIARLGRPKGHKFDRVSILTDGYDRKDVDAFAARLVAYFEDGRPMSIDEVRSIAFRPRKGGYRETQVDLLIDAVVNVMLAVR